MLYNLCLISINDILSYFNSFFVTVFWGIFSLHRMLFITIFKSHWEKQIACVEILNQFLRILHCFSDALTIFILILNIFIIADLYSLLILVRYFIEKFIKTFVMKLKYLRQSVRYPWINWLLKLNIHYFSYKNIIFILVYSSQLQMLTRVIKRFTANLKNFQSL